MALATVQCIIMVTLAVASGDPSKSTSQELEIESTGQVRLIRKSTPAGAFAQVNADAGQVDWSIPAGAFAQVNAHVRQVDKAQHDGSVRAHQGETKSSASGCDAPGGSLPRGTSQDSLAATWAALKVGNIKAQKSAPPLHDSVLSNKIGSSNNWLVFTSAGDMGHVNTWMSGGSPLFDVFAAYYGGQGEEGLGHMRKYTTLAWASKGDKWQNLFYSMTSPNTKHLFEHYSAVLVCDDDIDLDVPKVHALFEAHKKYDMLMLGPSFSPGGHAAWRSALHEPNSFLRYGAFVEMTCPLLTMTALKDFMFTMYHPSVISWGVDMLYTLYFNFPANPRRWGVLDAVTLFNGLTHKNGVREISMLASTQVQKAAYIAHMNEYKLTVANMTCGSYMSRQWHHRNYSCGRILMSRSDPGQGGEYISENCKQQLSE